MIKNLTPKEIRNQRRTNRSKRNNVAHPTRLRMVVSKSLKHINVQIIDDNEMKTLVSASSLDKDLHGRFDLFLTVYLLKPTKKRLISRGRQYMVGSVCPVVT